MYLKIAMLEENLHKLSGNYVDITICQSFANKYFVKTSIRLRTNLRSAFCSIKSISPGYDCSEDTGCSGGCNCSFVDCMSSKHVMPFLMKSMKCSVKTVKILFGTL